MSDTTYHQTGDNASYTFWTWLLAICLAIFLFWQWQHGRGPSYASACCAGSVTSVPAETAAEPFHFIASNAEGYHATGDASTIGWADKSQALVDWLKQGADWKVEGDAKTVTLTGTVDSEATKIAKGEEAQAFFGSDVTIDNQLVVKASEPTAAPVAAATPPSAAKIYFDTAVSALPSDASLTVSAIVDWVKNNPNAKVVISGFHDPRGDIEFNRELAKKRAISVSELLMQAGVNQSNIELRKPQNTEGDGNLQEARRVEISLE